jgi:hypothetical protein
MKSSTVLNFFLPVLATALPKGPLGGLTAGLTGTVGGLTTNSGVGADLTGSGSAPSSGYNAGSGSSAPGSGYNAGSGSAPAGYNAPSSGSGYSLTPSFAAGGIAGSLPVIGGLASGLTGNLPLVGGLLGGGSSEGAWSPCAGTTGSAQCCATDVLGVADLDCLNRKSEIIFV